LEQSNAHKLQYSIDECIGEARPFWKGDSTKANLQNEIINFLGQASSNEIAILCIQTDGSEALLYFAPDFVSGSELLSWLQAVNTTTCVVIDACHSGSFISNGQGGILGPGRMVLCSSLSSQVSIGISEPYVGGYFMGFQYVGYPGGPAVGVIGATIAGTDTDGDGWLSFSETFVFAKNSVDQITNQDPVSFNGLPDGFDPPFILLPPNADFYFTPSAPRVNKTVTFNASQSKGNISSYKWGFGDGNTATATEPVVDHIYAQSGNYTVTLNVTDGDGQLNTKRSILVVEGTLPGDINDDDIVDIFDAILLANAYNSIQSDPNWNFAADLNSDNAVDIYDAIILANNFNQHYP
jgi:hypothetical protein